VANKSIMKDKDIANMDITKIWPKPSSNLTESMARELLKKYPLTEEERKIFIQSKKRVNKILGIEKFKDVRIVVEIVESKACIAGHAVGDRIYFDSMGRLLVDKADKPICSRLLNKIWYRLIMIMDRIADDTGDYIRDGDFTGDIIDVRMSCYGADFPYGDCGQVLMKVFCQKSLSTE